MSLVTNILWRLMPATQRRMLLSLAPQYQQRHIERVLKGRAIYQPCFDQHEALFIHVPKSAGRSVVRGLFDVKSVEHAPAAWYQQLDAERFARYYKFTFVRNPWDRAVSAYTYLYKGGSAASDEDSQWSAFVGSYDSFDAFICDWLSEENTLRNALFTPQVVFLKDIFGRIDMDFIGRFENLQADFAQVAKTLGVDAQLPHLNQSRSEDFRSFYTARSRELVASVYAEDIEAFGYEFN